MENGVFTLLGGHLDNFAIKEGTFCLIYHKDEDGWKQCGSCERKVHCGCIMALNLFDATEGFGIICKKCVKKKSPMASNIGASSSVPNPVDFSQSDISSIFENFTGEEFLTDPGTVTLLSNDAQNLENVVADGSVNLSQLPNSGLTFLFEKKLTRTDCKPATGRLLLPKHLAEAFLPKLPRQQNMPLDIKDTEGRTWNLTLSWSGPKKSRKYVIDGIKPCLLTMEWNAGDTLKVYRQLSGDGFVMELVRGPDSASSS